MANAEEEVTDAWDLSTRSRPACTPAIPTSAMLAETLDAYAEDFPDEFFGAVGALAPGLLSGLLISIDTACRDDAKPRKNVLRLADRKPEGNA